MRRFIRILFALFVLIFFAVPSLCETRALLVACSDFVTQPDLGSAISGNLHMIGSALLGADPALSSLSIEDGTIGTVDELKTAIDASFSQAQENDLSILYLCTHGVLSSSDDGNAYLLLGDGKTESPLGSDALYRLLSSVQGEKLLILDACFSGALLGRGMPDSLQVSGTKSMPEPFASPFLADSSFHVLTSASGHESSWYYDAQGLQNGAVSYFASALSSGLGLYAAPEADLNGDDVITLSELHRYLSVSVASSSSQLLSSRADDLILPRAQSALLSRPLSAFSYGPTLLTAEDPVIDFSFTATSETSIQYRLVESEGGSWNWKEAQTFLDGSVVPAGRHTRSITLPTVKHSDSGYLMLQVFAVSDAGVVLCSERLIAIQSCAKDAVMKLDAPANHPSPGVSEIPISAGIGTPAEISVSILDESGSVVRRLASSQCTHPGDQHTLRLYWDGRDAAGAIVPEGTYTIRAESFVGLSRIKATASLTVSGE